MVTFVESTHKMKVSGEDLPVNPGGRVRSVDINENAYTQRMVNAQRKSFKFLGGLTSNNMDIIKKRQTCFKM